MRERDLGIQLSGDLQSKDTDKNVTKPSVRKEELESASHPGRDEHTILGRVIGNARDLFQGEAHTLREKQERASSNDEIAKIAVDTVASIPKVHFAAAGLMRAVTMVNPDQGFGKNIVSGVANFAEGVALNKVSHIGTQGVHGLLRSGAAMGAVRTTFDQNTWLNKDGRFDAVGGAEHVVTGTVAGALINVPAGFVGSRVASRFGAENATSSAPGRLLASLTSGYASGTVFGGLDAVVAGGSTKDVLGAMGTGGVTGALSGGLVHGFSGAVGRITGDSASPRLDFRPLPETQTLTRMEQPVRQVENSKLNMYTHKDQMDHVYKTLAFEPKPRADFSELTTRLIPNMRSQTLVEHRVSSANANKVWDSEASFNRDLVPEKTRMTVYGAHDAEGKKLPIDIFVPVDHDNSVIKPMRALRKLADTDLPIDEKGNAWLGHAYNVVKNRDQGPHLDKLSPELQLQVLHDFATMSQSERELTATVIRAREERTTHPNASALLPEDVLPYLEQTKNVKSIILSDTNWSHDTWFRQNKNAGFHSDTFTAAATADHTTGTIQFYKVTERPDPLKPQTKEIFSDILNHEDTHLMRGFKSVYDAAHMLDFNHFDEPAFSVTDYAKLNEEEDRAESRTAFLQPDPTGFWLMNEKAPIRAAILSRVESDYIDSFIHDGGEHPNQDAIRRRIDHVEKYTIPVARAMTAGHLMGDDPERTLLAARVLGTIGEKADIPDLEKIARRDGRALLFASRQKDAEQGLPPKSRVEREAEDRSVSDPDKPTNKMAKEAFESIVKLSGYDDNDRFRAVVKRAASDPTLRPLAIEKLKDGSFGEPGKQYAKMFQNFGNPAHVTNLLVEIQRTKDPGLKQIGFAEMMRLTENNPREQLFLAQKMYDQQPTLADQAREVLERLRQRPK